MAFTSNKNEYEAMMARAKRQGGDTRIKVNPNRIFYDGLHLPRESRYPLYPHGKDSHIVGEKESIPSWVKASVHTFNSPTNIRTVYFEFKQVAVDYWVTPWVQGEAAKLKYLHGAYVNKDGKHMVLNPYTFLFQNCGFRSLTGTPNVPNLEEVWITSEMFANQDPECAAFYNSVLTGLKPGQVEFDEFPKKVFEKETQGWIRDLFPLLRTIVVAVTPFQFACWRNNPSLSGETSFYTIHTLEVENHLRKTFPTQRCTISDAPELMEQFASAKGMAFVVCHIPTSDVSKFTLGDYKFDELRLNKVKAAILDKYGAEAVEKRIVKEVEDAASSDNVLSLFQTSEKDYELLTRQIYGGVCKFLEDEDYDCREFQIGKAKDDKWACKFRCEKDGVSVEVGIWDNIGRYRTKVGSVEKNFTAPKDTESLIQAVYQSVCDAYDAAESVNSEDEVLLTKRVKDIVDEQNVVVKAAIKSIPGVGAALAVAPVVEATIKGDERLKDIAKEAGSDLLANEIVGSVVPGGGIVSAVASEIAEEKVQGVIEHIVDKGLEKKDAYKDSVAYLDSKTVYVRVKSKLKNAGFVNVGRLNVESDYVGSFDITTKDGTNFNVKYFSNECLCNIFTDTGTHYVGCVEEDSSKYVESMIELLLEVNKGTYKTESDTDSLEMDAKREFRKTQELVDAELRSTHRKIEGIMDEVNRAYNRLRFGDEAMSAINKVLTSVYVDSFYNGMRSVGLELGKESDYLLWKKCFSDGLNKLENSMSSENRWVTNLREDSDDSLQRRLRRALRVFQEEAERQLKRKVKIMGVKGSGAGNYSERNVSWREASKGSDADDRYAGIVNSMMIDP